MLYGIYEILLVFWVLGFSMNRWGGFVHVFLIIAVLIFLVDRIGHRLPTNHFPTRKTGHPERKAHY